MGIFLFYSYFAVGVPCLGFLSTSLYLVAEFLEAPKKYALSVLWGV